MFNYNPQPCDYPYLETSDSLEEKKATLLEMFENLMATVKCSQLQIRFEVLDKTGLEAIKNEDANSEET